MRLVQFKVQNYKRLENTDWVQVNDVTALVGGNESGKTASLQALWKLKPGRKNIILEAQNEFPRHRYTNEYLRGGKWPVVTAEFEINEILTQELRKIDMQFEKLKLIRCTNYYDDPVEISFLEFKLQELEFKEIKSILDEILEVINNIDVNDIQSIKIQEKDEESGLEEIWKKPDEILLEYKEKIGLIIDNFIKIIREESELNIKELFTSLLNDIQGIPGEPWKNEAITEISILLNPTITSLSIQEKSEKAKKLIWEAIPIFVYFDDYSMLETKIYIPEAVQKIKSTSLSLKVRSQWALMEMAGFPLQEIAELAFAHSDPEEDITAAQIKQIFQEVQKRAILAGAAAQTITEQFSGWWIQHRHTIDFRIDGEFFQIWVSDEKYKSLIEFEARSKGFRWFFTFYLVFMAETNYQHKDAILLLDEPGLHLYIPQQEKLIELFNRITKNNQIIYTTHSPFMIDSKNLEKVRIVEEDERGFSLISPDTGRSGDDVIFPIQAALGYQLAQTLFLARRVLMVEGETDYLLLIFLSNYLKDSGRIGLPNQMAITFAGGNSSIRPLTAMMAPQGFEIIILLDSDNPGKSVGKSLEQKGYTNFENVELTYYGDIIGLDSNYDLESLIPSKIYRNAVNKVFGVKIPSNIRASKKRTLSVAVKDWFNQEGIQLDKREVIIYILDGWKKGKEIPQEILDNAELIFKEVTKMIEEMCSRDDNKMV